MKRLINCACGFAARIKFKGRRHRNADMAAINKSATYLLNQSVIDLINCACGFAARIESYGRGHKVPSWPNKLVLRTYLLNQSVIDLINCACGFAARIKFKGRRHRNADMAVINKSATYLLITILVSICSLTSCSMLSLIKGDNLSSAIQSGNLECVKEAVDEGADINKKSLFYSVSECPLLFSINNGQRFIPEYLLSKGADPNYIDSAGISILMYTVGANKEAGLTYANATDNESYKVLLNDKRTDINLTGKLGYTALDYACRDNGVLDIVNELINHGAKISATTMKCAIEGYRNGFCEETVIKLVFNSLKEQKIQSGLDPEIEAAIQGDSSKLISLALAGKVKQENKQIVMLLTCAFGDAEALKALSDNDMDFNSYYYGDSYNRQTYLVVACSYGKLETIEYLLNEQANIEMSANELPYKQSKTPLTYALKYNRIDIADYLFNHGAKLQIADSGTSGARPDVLESACKSGDLDTIKWILAHGYPLDEERIVNAMSEAARYNHIDVLAYFLNDLKANINAENHYSTTLSNSTGISKLETIQFLIDNGADVNGGKDHIFTPLDRAVNSNRADILLYLINQGASVDLVGSVDGYKPSRPLTQAIENGYFDIVKILVEHGADLNYKEGWTGGKDTALEIAEKEGSQRITNYLKNVKSN